MDTHEAYRAASFDQSFNRAWRSAKPVTPHDLARWAEHYGADAAETMRTATWIHPSQSDTWEAEAYTLARIAGRFARRARYAF